MADLAALGLSVDSSQVKSATAALNDFSKAGQKAESAAGEFASSFTALTDSSEKYDKTTNRVINSLANQYARITLNGRALAQFNAVQSLGANTNVKVVEQISRAAGALYDMEQAQKRVAEATRAVSSVIKGMVSSLVTGGIAGIVAAVTAYAVEAFGAVNDLDEKLKANADTVRALKDAYGDVGKSVDVAVKESTTVLKTLLSLSTDELQNQLQKLSRSAVVSMSDFDQLGDAAGLYTERASRKFGAFKGTIDDFRASINAGTPDVRAFREAVARIADSSGDQNVRKLAKELLDITKNANDADMALRSAGKATRGFSADALAAAEQGEAFAKALKKLDSTVSPNLSVRERIMKNYLDALKDAPDVPARLLAAQKRDDQLAILSANERKKAVEDAAKAQESAAKRFQSALNASDRHGAGVDAQIDAIGKGAAELARLQTQYRLTEAAQQAFGTVSEATAAKIAKAAEAAGEAAEKLARARINDNIRFDRQASFLSQEDVQIAERLRGLYPDVATALSSVEASAMRTNEAMRGLSNLGQDVNRGLLVEFGQQLRNGASAWDAFKNAGVNALGKIADKLMQMAADNLWRSAFGGSSGGLLGGLGSLFGIGGGSSAAGSVGVVGAAGGMVVPTFFHGGGLVGAGGYQNGAFPSYLFANAPRFHSGVDLRSDEIPAILQRGERVIPRGQNDNGGGNVINMPISVNASGNDPAAIAGAIRDYVNSSDFDARVVNSVTSARKQRKLA